MAESAASALFNVIFQKLADEAFKKYARSQNIHSELKQLTITLTQIQDLIHDACQKEVTNKTVKSWLNRLQHLAYDIDDVLDDVATEAMRRELTPESETGTSMVRKFIPTCCTNFSLSHRLSHKLDSINKELQLLEKQKSDLGLIVKDEKPKNASRRNETCLLESDIVGRKGEREKLINKLLQDEPSKESFIIVPIVGMGGVGKTTLARILYNDARVKEHFELMAWVCVSDEFDIFKISETIFQSVATENKQFKDINLLQIALREQLMDKRFLVVLDDVWNVNYGDWENLVRPFHSGAPGSRVIITTRKKELLERLGFDHLDLLESLSFEDGLSLFAFHALGVDNLDSHVTLKPLGEGIVKKCGGLPLALKAIGRLLRTHTNEEDWNEVLNSEIWDLENANEIVPALRLSYQDLSANLKRLFAYCSLFPKDFLFDKEELVLLWMAEGYLNESPANKHPERLGQEYFEKLLSRSFFQPAPSGESFFVMHDLMNDLATFVAGEYFLRFDNQMEVMEEVLAKYRHMSFVREKYVAFQKFGAFGRARSLRTLLPAYVGVDQGWNEFYLSSKILVDLLPELPLLRVLCLSRFKINEVPDSIGTLKHLRYLNLSKTDIKELLENVGNLYNLQTLIVFGCWCLTKLPKSFLNLKMLRHFDTRNTPLKKLPLGIGGLKSLQTLSRIIIEGNNGFAITELKGLKDLHGEICIEGLNKVQSSMNAREANLSSKGFDKLKLKWDDGSIRETPEMEVLNELKPNSDKLKKLVIECYEGIDFPNWVGDSSFDQLVQVSLRGCRKCTSLPSLGQLPSLKELLIQGLDEVKVIGSELTRTNDVVFPSLEILKFEDMSGWEAWSTGNKIMFPRLRELHIENCPNLIDVSIESLPSLRFLRMNGCCESVLRSMVRAASSTTKLEIRSISRLTYEVWKGVIEYLGVVEELHIICCNEIRYLWESVEEASKVLVNLKELGVYYCENLVSLGEKEEEEDNTGSNFISSLRILTVYDCRIMERLCCPNSIESLDITRCSSIQKFSILGATTGGGGKNLKSVVIYGYGMHMEIIGKISMHMLQDIYIVGWRNLKSITQLSNSSHLTSLIIRNCQSMESFSDLQLSKLTRLFIVGCESFESFPNLQLPNLISWKIADCKNLESFPDLLLPNLTMLEDMCITDCPMIDDSFHHGLWPPKLHSLTIGGLKKPISEWGDLNFPASLVSLRLYKEAHVRNLSQLSHFFPPSLTELHIEEFDHLESLSMGLQHLTSLQHLIINNCQKVNDLPKTLLPSLLSLFIFGCPKLKERCEGKDSHYWPLISHIPRIEIDTYFISLKVATLFLFLS